MRIIMGSIQQETNTFNPAPATVADFILAEGEAMYGHVAVADYLRSEGCCLIPTLYAHALPAGRLAQPDFRVLLERMLAAFPVDEKIDGVWLYCHGALDVDGIGSGDVAILQAVRKRVGQAVPIAVALDFHANLNERICELANIICGYRTAPHTDMAQTQLRAARLLVESIRRGELPQSVLMRVPLIITGDKVITAEEPMRTIIQACETCSENPGILDASVFNGQPWVDAPDTGASAVAVARNAEALPAALACTEKLARMLWQARDQYRFQAVAVDVQAAVSQALAQTVGPVFISDSGDNTTAGAPGESVFLLSSLLQHPLDQVLLAGLTAPASVIHCQSIKEGQTIRFPDSVDDEFARLMCHLNLQPVLRGRGRLLGWYGEDAGDYVVLTLPGLDVLLTRQRCAIISPEIIESASLHFPDYRVIIVKLGYLFPALAAVAKQAYLALTPGASCEMIESIPYQKINRPIYPIDRDFDWQPGNSQSGQTCVSESCIEPEKRLP